MSVLRCPKTPWSAIIPKRWCWKQKPVTAQRSTVGLKGNFMQVAAFRIPSCTSLLQFEQACACVSFGSSLSGLIRERPRGCGKIGLLLRPLFPPLDVACPAGAWWAPRGHECGNELSIGCPALMISSFCIVIRFKRS